MYDVAGGAGAPYLDPLGSLLGNIRGRECAFATTKMGSGPGDGRAGRGSAKQVFTKGEQLPC